MERRKSNVERRGSFAYGNDGAHRISRRADDEDHAGESTTRYVDGVPIRMDRQYLDQWLDRPSEFREYQLRFGCRLCERYSPSPKLESSALNLP